MSEVTGAAEAAADLAALADALTTGLGDALAAAARVQAARRAPTLAQLAPPVVQLGGVTLDYAGVINPAGFERAVAPDLEAAAVAAVAAHIDTTIDRAG